MAHYPRLRIILLQALQQPVQRVLLLRCAGVGRPSADVQAALVADTYRVSVVALGMCSLGVERTPCMNHPVAGDVVVVADVGKAPVTMVTTAVVHGIAQRGAGGTTMNHNQVDATVVLILAAVQDGIAHKAPQACRPKVVATAVSTVMTIFRILLQMLFLFSMLLSYEF